MNPKSPPRGHFDLYGKRRQTLKVQLLEREIGLLEEELKYLEGLHPASNCCKELDIFVGAKPDPFIARSQEIQDSHRSWKRIWTRFGPNLRWIGCLSGCQIHLGIPNCCKRCQSSRFQLPGCGCLKKINCRKCCNFLDFSGKFCSCRCFKVRLC